ncbi:MULTISPECIES: DUF2493 domain-containing protein [Rhodomicrobium]|uniref:DUF2493 domain-containing protein n=1 Tax=Rhodomicrobium TaxID=1068 RepID=UPI000B4C06A3|nr:MULTISPECIES: DUF2493 domain-containing protein [Rhodomicrobium]
MRIDLHDNTDEPEQLSATARILDHLALHGGHLPGDPDPRALPDDDKAHAGLRAMLNALASIIAGSRLEDDTESLLWTAVNIFHAASLRLQRRLDDNERAQRQSQIEQDGSEIRSVDLERLIAAGEDLTARHETYLALRDYAATLFASHTGSSWRPRTGSMTPHKTLTAAMIDSRDYLAAKRRKEIEPLLPTGTMIAVAGGVDFNEHRLIWETLDKVRAKHTGMVLLHGGASKGAEYIASRWADNREIPQIVFKPDWTRFGKAAPFKRNDQLVDAMPAGLIVFPGGGVVQNLADKARAHGICVWLIDGGGA